MTCNYLGIHKCYDLHSAVTQDHPQCLRRYLESGNYDINGFPKCGQKWSPMHLACQHARLECLRILIEYEADLNKAEPLDGYTALHYACGRGHEDCIKLLLNKIDILNINHQNKRGKTALHLACNIPRKNIVQCLLNVPNIDLKIRDNEGKTVYDNSLHEFRNLLERYETITKSARKF